MRIAGVKFEKDAKGEKRYVRLDLKKHSEAVIPFLEKLGALNGHTDEDAAYREKFYRDRANGITGDELVRRVTEHLKKLPWKK